MSDSKLQTLIVEQMGDALVYADRQGQIVTWNAAAERLFGYSRDEAIGQSLDIIIPERLRDAHWAGFDRALEAGAVKTPGRAMLTRAQMSSGETVYVEMTFAVVKSADGTALGSVAIARDAKPHRDELKALRTRLAELEGTGKS